MDESGQTLTSLFVLQTVRAERGQCAGIGSPVGGYRVLTVLKGWLRKCPTLCSLLRDENENYICFLTMFQLVNESKAKERSIY